MKFKQTSPFWNKKEQTLQRYKSLTILTGPYKNLDFVLLKNQKNLATLGPLSNQPTVNRNRLAAGSELSRSPLFPSIPFCYTQTTSLCITCLASVKIWMCFPWFLHTKKYMLLALSKHLLLTLIGRNQLVKWNWWEFKDKRPHLTSLKIPTAHEEPYKQSPKGFLIF